MKSEEKTCVKERNSNLELFRIITMLLIVAHHYVVNSGLTDLNGPVFSNPLSIRSLSLLIFGAFGKTGINCFVLITGYFMCKSKITPKKFFKLFFEVMFYRFVIGIIFWISGYEPFSIKSLILLFIPIQHISNGFTSAFLVFFLFIPFINILIHHLNEIQYIKVLCLTFFTYVFLSSIPFFSVDMNYVSWFIVLYFFASYIRMYPKKIFDKTGLWGVLSFVLIVLCAASVVGGTYAGVRFEISKLTYFFVSDSNKFLAFCTGFCLFNFFRTVKIKQSKIINTIAASTFGVLLIHANSETMRKWLWRDVLDNAGHYGSRLMPLHAIGSVICVFVICVLIDQLRIRLIEKPFFKLFDRHFYKIENAYHKIEDKFVKKICQR